MQPRMASFIVLLALLCASLPHQAHASPKSVKRFKFSHSPPALAVLGQQLLIKCQAVENDELEQMYLYFRTKRTSVYHFLRMKLSAGIVYSATIAKTYVKGPYIEYYIVGTDTDRTSHQFFGSPSHPHRLKLQQKAPRRSDGAAVITNKDDDSLADTDTIYSASRREQRIQDAPSVVSVITSADIQANGWRTVLEILRYAVGVHIDANGHWANFGIRGVNPRLGYGEKVIVLLDGHNMGWRQFNRNYLNPSWVTVDNIKRIEIIRGPGSSLWGANAISGVINIITKTAHNLKGMTAVGGGSPISGTYFLTLMGGKEFSNGIAIRTSFSLHRQNRSPVLAPIREFLDLSDSDYAKLRQRAAGIDYQRLNYIEQKDEYLAQNFYIRASWKGFALSFHQGRYDPQAPMSTFSELGGDDSRFVTDRYITRLTWGTAIGSWGTFLAYSSFDHYSFAHGTAYELNPFSQTERSLVRMAGRDARLEVGAQFSAQLFSSDAISASLITGAEYEFNDIIRWHFPEVWEQNQLALPQFQNHRFSAFLQVQATFAKVATLTLGGRFDYDSVYKQVFTPRAALVITPGLGFYAKALYGNAYKSPSYHDLYYFRKDKFYGNTTLRPESVHTMELQVGWQRSRLLAISVNGYLSLFQDLITYDPKPKGYELAGASAFPNSQLPGPDADIKQKDNTSALTTFGGELELRLYLIKNLSVLGSAGLFFGHSGTLGQSTGPLYYSPAWTGSLAASYRFQAGPVRISVALGARLTGPKLTPPKDFAPQTDSVFGASNNNGQPIGVPYWSGSQEEAQRNGVPFDPTLETPINIRTFVTIQVLDVFKHFDFSLRMTNLLNRDNYDSNDLLLYPQEKFNMMLWVKAKY